MRADRFIPLRQIRLGAAVPADSPGRPWTGPLAVLQAWSQVVRPPLSERAAVSGWRDGVLTVSVVEARWQATVEVLAPQLRAALNAWLGSDAVSEIRIRPGGSQRE